MKLAIVGARNPGLSYAEWEQLLLSRVSVENILNGRLANLAHNTILNGIIANISAKFYIFVD